MSNIEYGPGVFLAQFLGKPGFETFEACCRRAAEAGFDHIQIPAWEPGVIDLDAASESKDYCNDLQGRVRSWGVRNGISTVATHLFGQLMAVNPAYSRQFRKFAPTALGLGGGRETAHLYEWATEQMRKSILASKNLGLSALPSFTGSFMWPYLYPWPAQSPELFTRAWRLLARRWIPILGCAVNNGQSIAFELHQGEDVHSVGTFWRFFDEVGEHAGARVNFDESHFVLQGADPADVLEELGAFVTARHVKDAIVTEHVRTEGYLGGWQPWGKRATHFKTPGYGQVDYQLLEIAAANAGLRGLPYVLEWEDPHVGYEQGFTFGQRFIDGLLQEPRAILEKEDVYATDGPAFDDFARADVDLEEIAQMLGVTSEELG